MLRVVGAALRAAAGITRTNTVALITSRTNLVQESQKRCLNIFTQKCNFLPAISNQKQIGEHLTQNLLQPSPTLQIPTRTLIKFSRRKGKRKSVRAVVRRFKRLHWGGWIRTVAGRNRYVWQKTLSQRKRRVQHILCNAKQSWLLDVMVTNFWRRPKYYVEDPYEPYHTRDFYAAKKTPYE